MRAGETARLILEKESPETPAVLPLDALQNDGRPYVWLVEEVPGPWGSEYMVKKEYVDVWYLGVRQVALSSEIGLPVVRSAERPLTDGQTVRFDP